MKSLRRVFVFLLIGTICTLFGATLLKALVTAGWSVMLANAAEGLITIELNFVLHNRYTWQTQAGDRSFLTKIVRFHAGKAVAFALNFGCFWLLVSVLGMDYLRAYYVCVLLITTISFLINDRFVFRK